jgi:hypothetical protein
MGAPLARALGRSVLELSAVRPQTTVDYLRRVRLFSAFVTENKLVPSSELDSVIVTWFDMLFQRGCHSADGAKFMAALAHIWPALKPKAALPRAWRAITGWRKLRPTFSRAPLPFKALLGIMGAAVWQGRHEEALAFLLAFACYLRPGELLQLTVDAVVPPVTGPGGSPFWSLILGDRRGSRPAKSGEFDESVIFDWEEFEWVGTMLQALRERRAVGPLWSFDAPLLTTALTDAARLAHVDILSPQLYSLRHGGASHDAVSHRRSLLSIKRRGRWKSDSSVRNYEKAASALREAHRMPPSAQVYARRVEAGLGEMMLGCRAAPIPPGASGQPSV